MICCHHVRLTPTMHLPLCDVQVIELGQVGLAQRAGSQGIMRFFAHTERGGSTDKSQVVQALQQAAGASPGELQVGK